MARKTYMGRFTPKNPEKYVGKLDQIIFRSSWELKFMKWLDTNTRIKKWGAEEIAVNYFDPATDKHRRYFPDMFVIGLDPQGKEYKLMIEIKPFEQTIKPEPKFGKNGKPTPSYLIEEMTFATNQAKWDAAKKFCSEHNVQFLILDEYALGIRKRQ